MVIANTLIDVASVLDKDLGEVSALVEKSKADDATIADLTAKLADATAAVAVASDSIAAANAKADAAILVSADLQSQLDATTAAVDALKAKADAIDALIPDAPAPTV